MTEPPPPPGWYPDPAMPGTQRYWDGTTWSEHVAPAQPTSAQQARGGPSVIMIAGGILLAALVIWVIYAVATANDDIDCATNSASGQSCN